MFSGTIHKSCQSCPLVQTGYTPLGVISSNSITIGKFKKIFFYETKRCRAFMFCVHQWLIITFIDPANHAPGVQIGHAPGAPSTQKSFTYLRTIQNIVRTCWLSGQRSLLPFATCLHMRTILQYMIRRQT